MDTKFWIQSQGLPLLWQKPGHNGAHHWSITYFLSQQHSISWISGGRGRWIYRGPIRDQSGINPGPIWDPDWFQSGTQIEKSIWDQSGINPGFNPGSIRDPDWKINLGPIREGGGGPGLICLLYCTVFPAYNSCPSVNTLLYLLVWWPLL